MEYLALLTGVTPPAPPRSYHVAKSAAALAQYRLRGIRGFDLGTSRKKLALDYAKCYSTATQPNDGTPKALAITARRVHARHGPAEYVSDNPLTAELASQREMRLLTASMSSQGRRLREVEWQADGGFRLTYDSEEGDGATVTRSAVISPSHRHVNVAMLGFMSASNCRSTLRELFTSRGLPPGTVLGAGELPKSFEVTAMAAHCR